MDYGFLLIDKGEGVSSRAVDNAVMRLFSSRHVGHLGTLDPFATGLLIVSVNKGGKFLPFVDDAKKTYVATLRLGVSTSTGDPEGEVIEEKEIPALTLEGVKAVAETFLGESKQLPPMTSAIKIQGKALYSYAHKGEEIAREKRTIFIDSLDILSLEKDQITFATCVSKGTYIRVLGEDLAKALGTVGYLTSLRRVKVGDISVEEAVKLEDITLESLREPTPYLRLYPQVEVASDAASRIKNGMKLALPGDAPFLLLTHEGKALAVYEKESAGRYRCFRGLF
ncbi:MAG: tRNA pseudouridine(55) synthase TruB [Bacilli bacterium]|nr:tRNA pseudouridine(55) synthase TruB [Bacilli bacterium]